MESCQAEVCREKFHRVVHAERVWFLGNVKSKVGGADLETGMAYGGYPFNGCTCRSLRNGSVSRRYKIASVVLDGERQFNLNGVREKNGSSNAHLEEKTNSTVLKVADIHDAPM